MQSPTSPKRDLFTGESMGVQQFSKNPGVSEDDPNLRPQLGVQCTVSKKTDRHKHRARRKRKKLILHFKISRDFLRLCRMQSASQPSSDFKKGYPARCLSALSALSALSIIFLANLIILENIYCMWTKLRHFERTGEFVPRTKLHAVSWRRTPVVKILYDTDV